ncbi:MAG: hypothetical protein Q4E12_01245 [Coriobacteriia bacterium]|nr:hypothetical protein [Coriobacteriia bacterium]
MKQKTAPLSIALIAALLCCMLALCGCQQTANQSNSADEELAIGEQTGNCYPLKLTNSTGKSVSGIAIKQPGEETHSANMMPSDARVSDGKTCIIYIPKTTQTTDGAYLVEIKITFITGLVVNLHYMDLEDFSEATLLLSGKIGYVTYQSKTAGRLVNTLELQTYYYNLEDPDAAARDAAEEEEEKRRLEKLEEDLKRSEEEAANAATNSENSTSNSEGTKAEENVQGLDVEDDPLEFDYDFSGNDDTDGYE